MTITCISCFSEIWIMLCVSLGQCFLWDLRLEVQIDKLWLYCMLFLFLWYFNFFYLLFFIGEDKPSSSEDRDHQEQIEAGKGRRLVTAEDSGGTSFGGGKSRRSRKDDASPDSSEGQSTSKFESSVSICYRLFLL